MASDFFGGIGKKITKVTGDFSGTVSDQTEILKCNNEIKNLNSQIDAAYAAIGKSYYERHSQDADSEEREGIEKINTLKAQIEEFREKIRALKGLQVCPGCGAEVPVGTAFCNNCGAKIPAPAPKPAAGTTCPNCGAQVPEGSRFCTKCGTKIVPPEEATKPAVKICPNCGAHVPEGNLFCTNCGARVGKPAPAPQPEPEPAPEPSPESAPAPQPEPEPTPEPETEPAVKICPSCGASVEGDSLFCTNCGTKIG